MNKFSKLLTHLALVCVALCAPMQATRAEDLTLENPVYRNLSNSDVTVALAQNGTAVLPIVVSEKADEDTKALANELADYLQRISGATFEVKTGDGKKGIVLGTLDQFPTPELNESLEIVKGIDGREAFAIRTSEKRVLLLAATPRSLMFVTYRFLEELGVRWLAPAQHWTVVPSTPGLKWDKDITDRPTILNRGIWVSWGFFGDTPATRFDREWNKARSNREYSAWSRHNFQGGSMQVNTGHSWFEIIKNRPELAQHPEYFALVNGKREVHWEAKLELSNPAVRQVFVDYALDFFKNNPDADMVSVDPSDGGGWSESPESAAMGSVSDQVFTMVNEVARAVQEKYPGKYVGLLAYNFHAMPPTFELEPNVYVQLPTAFIQGKYSLDDLIEMWPRKTGNFGFYDYYSVWLWRRDFLPGGTAANPPALAAKLKDWARLGVSSISAESGNDWGLSGRGYYTAAKMMWNPNLDYEALSEDYYEKAFGAGADAMKQYFDLVEGANKNRLSRNTYGLALRYVDKAGREADGDEGATARIDDIKQYLRYQHLNWEWERVNTTDQITPEKVQAWNARIEQTFRERFSYMTHFAAQWQNGYIDLDSVAQNPDKFPDKPYSREERDAQWTEMMNTYKPLEIHEKKFSPELVAVDFPVKAGEETVQHFAGRAGFNFVTNGEPLEFTIQTDLLPGFENRPDARYTIAEASGKTVAQGRMDLDGKEHQLSFDLPKGTYGLDFDGAQGSWTLKAPKTQPVSQMLLKQWPRNQLAPAQNMFLYVPKGTRQIELSWSGEPLQLTTPKGEAAPIAARNDDHYYYTVPAGSDGQVWALPTFTLAQLWFYNIPNYLAASSDALPIPSDVAQEDGLTIGG